MEDFINFDPNRALKEICRNFNDEAIRKKVSLNILQENVRNIDLLYKNK